MDYRLLKIIACPICNSRLYYSRDKQELICDIHNIAFPLQDGIPILLENEARALDKKEKRV